MRHYARPDVVRLLLDLRPRSVVEDVAFGERPAATEDAPTLERYQELAARLAELEEEVRRLKGQ